MKGQPARVLLGIGFALCIQAPIVLADMQAILNNFSTDLERASAQAVIETYNDLITTAGCDDLMLVDPGTLPGNGGPVTCTGSTYRLFSNVRHLMHTANEISNDPVGRTSFSLGLDQRGLGLALRWNAAEEYNSQASLSSDFLQGQLTGLSSRITAIRLGDKVLSGINPTDVYQGYASSANLEGGGASDEGFSRWGGFIHYSSGSGNKAPGVYEDAFDIEGNDITFGGDYRFNSEWVAGIVGGVMDQEIDFDSALSTVDGGVISEGISVMPFVLYQGKSVFVSAALGYQSLSFDTDRAIRYSSLNPDIPPPSTRTESNTDATTISFSGELGYNFIANAFSAEPYIKIDYADTSVDGFVERDLNNSAFDLAVAEQSFDSMETSIGLRLRYTFSPSFGVFTPFVGIQSIKQSKSDPHKLSARYANAVTATNTFQLSSDEIDDQYSMLTYGLASVIRGSRQTRGDSVSSGGIQVFIQYKEISGLDKYNYSAVTAGLRYEF